MTPIRSRVSDTASPWMLIVSIGLHVMALVVVVLVSPSLVAPRKPPDEVISHVTLVEPPVQAPPAAIFPTQPAAEAPALPTPEVLAARADDSGSQPREMVQASKPESSRPKALALKKRKRAVQRVEEPVEKPKEAKKPKASEELEKPQAKEKEVAAEQTTEKPKPKEPENPDEVLEKRKQALRDEVERRKGQGAASPTPASTPARPGPSFGPDSNDEELLQWLGWLKNRINDQWTVFGDNSSVKRVTVIGVQVADNGALTDPKVKVSSGDVAFDRSAMRAVLQVEPFTPAPSEVRDRIRQAGGLALRFTPGGLQ